MLQRKGCAARGRKNGTLGILLGMAAAVDSAHWIPSNISIQTELSALIAQEESGHRFLLSELGIGST